MRVCVRVRVWSGVCMYVCGWVCVYVGGYVSVCVCFGVCTCVSVCICMEHVFTCLNMWMQEHVDHVQCVMCMPEHVCVCVCVFMSNMYL